MTDELEMMWRVAVVAYSRHYTDICLDGVGKIYKKISQYNRCPGRDSKLGPPYSVSVLLFLVLLNQLISII
jgi:hypothetical protein